MTFRLEVGGRSAEVWEHDGSNRHGAGWGRHRRNHRRSVASAGTDVAAVTLGPVVGNRRALVSVPWVCVRGNHIRVVVPMHAVMSMADCDRELARLTRLCAKHGRSHRAPEGKQHANKQQNKDAKYSHC